MNTTGHSIYPQCTDAGVLCVYAQDASGNPIILIEECELLPGELAHLDTNKPLGVIVRGDCYQYARSDNFGRATFKRLIHIGDTVQSLNGGREFVVTEINEDNVSGFSADEVPCRCVLGVKLIETHPQHLAPVDGGTRTRSMDRYYGGGGR